MQTGGGQYRKALTLKLLRTYNLRRTKLHTGRPSYTYCNIVLLMHLEAMLHFALMNVTAAAAMCHAASDTAGSLHCCNISLKRSFRAAQAAVQYTVGT